MKLGRPPRSASNQLPRTRYGEAEAGLRQPALQFLTHLASHPGGRASEASRTKGGERTASLKHTELTGNVSLQTPFKLLSSPMLKKPCKAQAG